MFSKKYTTISQISNLITHKEPKAHDASTWNCRAKQTSGALVLGNVDYSHSYV